MDGKNLKSLESMDNTQGREKNKIERDSKLEKRNREKEWRIYGEL
jgi:hypothetical protein